MRLNSTASRLYVTALTSGLTSCRGFCPGCLESPWSTPWSSPTSMTRSSEGAGRWARTWSQLFTLFPFTSFKSCVFAGKCLPQRHIQHVRGGVQEGHVVIKGVWSGHCFYLFAVKSEVKHFVCKHVSCRCFWGDSSCGVSPSHWERASHRGVYREDHSEWTRLCHKRRWFRNSDLFFLFIWNVCVDIW